MLTCKLSTVSFPLCCTLLIYSNRRLETLGPFGGQSLFLLYFSLLLSPLSPSFSNKHTNTERSTYSIYKHSLCVNTEKQTDVHTHSHTHTHTHTHTKPPSGQGLTLTLKGLCLAPVIATPQAGYVVSISTSTPLCVSWVRVCETTMYGVNSCRHPPHPELTVTWVCVHMPFGLFFCFFLCVNNWETTAVPPTMLREAEQLCLWRCLFVVVGRQEMRSCWGLWLCARRAYRRAGPGREENTNHLLAGLTGFMEMRNSSFSAMYQSKVESVLVTPGTVISPLLSIIYAQSVDYNPPFFIWENSACPHTQDIFHLISLQVTVFEGYIAEHRLLKHLPSASRPPFFIFWKPSRLPFPLCLSTQDLFFPVLHICHPPLVRGSLTAQINVSLQLHTTLLTTSRLPFNTQRSLCRNVPSFN